MSYDKIVGFGIGPGIPKNQPTLSPRELSYFERLGVPPIFHDLSKKMPEGNKEPEPKIILSGPAGFTHIRKLISGAQNAFLIPGQAYQGKDPLTSILLDTVQNGFPTAKLDHNNHTLRYRFEMNPVTGALTQGDFNEKSGLKGANLIGGCADRDEREITQRPGEPIGKAYEAFLRKYRRLNDPAFCDGVPFSDFKVFAGYQAARNEVGFAVKHPEHDVLFVFEGCEDFWHAMDGNMQVIPPRFYEFEAEVRQVWGELPSNVRTKQDMKQYVYSTLTNLRDYIHANTPGSSINLKSKAEITKEHLGTIYGFEHASLFELGLSKKFARMVPAGYDKSLDAVQYALLYGNTMDETLAASARDIHKSGARLHHEKNRYNSHALQPEKDSIGHGAGFITFRNDNLPRRAGLAPAPSVA